MKYVYYYICIFLVFLCSATCRAQDTALLMVHFGTTYDETRAKTIDAINEKAEKVCEVLVNRHSADAKKREHVLFIGHGTEGPATALYSQIDYMLRAGGYDNYHVATIEGYPTQETALAQIKAMKGKKVTLVPLLFVAGDHANNDISVEWKEALEKEGLTVDVRLEGLGEVLEIQELYIKKIK